MVAALLSGIYITTIRCTATCELVGSGDYTLRDAFALLVALCSPFHRRSSRAEHFSEEQLDREFPEDHPDGRLGGALERVLAHVEQGDATALEACKLVG